MALAPDRRACVLVRWHAAGNVPGFALVLVDDRRRTVGLGPVFPGACRALQWSEDGPLYETSFDVSGLLPWAAFRRVPAPDLEGALRTSAPLGLPG